MNYGANRRDYRLADLAERAAMSTRSLQRHFSELTGFRPMNGSCANVACAREMLESSQHSLQQISEMTGFGSEESFSTSFPTGDTDLAASLP